MPFKQMTRNFSHNEDICIESAWLNTSKESIYEDDQTFSRFWKMIYNEFVINCNEGVRSKRSVKNC